MNKNLDPQMIRMFIYSAVIGISSSFGFFMFTAWLAMSAFDKADENPDFYPVSAVTWLICLIVFVVLMVLWIIALVRQKSKSTAVGVSAAFAVAGFAIGFIAFPFMSAMATMT